MNAATAEADANPAPPATAPNQDLPCRSLPPPPPPSPPPRAQREHSCSLQPENRCHSNPKPTIPTPIIDQHPGIPRPSPQNPPHEDAMITPIILRPYLAID